MAKSHSYGEGGGGGGGGGNGGRASVHFEQALVLLRYSIVLCYIWKAISIGKTELICFLIEDKRVDNRNIEKIWA